MKAMGMTPIAYVFNYRCTECDEEWEDVQDHDFAETDMCQCGRSLDTSCTEIWPQEESLS